MQAGIQAEAGAASVTSGTGGSSPAVEGSENACFADFARAAADWTWETDRNLNYTRVSEGVARVFGVPPQRLHRCYIFSLTFFRQADESMLSVSDTMEAHGPFRNKLAAIRRADGETRQVLLSGVPVYDPATGNFAGYRGTGLDITDRGAMEAAFPEVWRHFRSFADLAADWLWESDAARRLTSLSPGYEDATGLRPQRSLGRDFVSLWLTPGADPDTPAAEAPPAIAVQRAFRDLRFDLRDTVTQEWRHLTISGEPLFDEDDNFLGYRGVGMTLGGHDPSVRESSPAPPPQKDDAPVGTKPPGKEDASEASLTALAALSHQLGVPLKAIIGFSESMRSEALGPLGNPTYRQYAEDIHDAARYLLGVGNEVFDLSSAEARRIALTEDWLDPIELAEACRRLIAGQASAAGVEIVLRESAEAPRLLADPFRLRQIILNLLDNAVLHSPRGGRIEIAVGGSVAGGLQFEVNSTAGLAGPQTAPAPAPPFVGQDQAAGNALRSGAGLGMSIVKSLIEVHGGRLRLISDQNGGIRAVAEFPAQRIEHNAPPTEDWKILF